MTVLQFLLKVQLKKEPKTSRVTAGNKYRRVNISWWNWWWIDCCQMEKKNTDMGPEVLMTFNKGSPKIMKAHKCSRSGDMLRLSLLTWEEKQGLP